MSRTIYRIKAEFIGGRKVDWNIIRIDKVERRLYDTFKTERIFTFNGSDIFWPMILGNDASGDLTRLKNIIEGYSDNACILGSKRQEEAIASFSEWDRGTYKARRNRLLKLGLYNDNGYIYGSEWLGKKIPDEDLNFFFTMCEPHPDFIANQGRK